MKTITKKERLLSKLYECQDLIIGLEGDDSESYLLVVDLIKELEYDIIEDKGFIGI